jgi:imidazolonepropionase-like amidohydrolase
MQKVKESESAQAYKKALERATANLKKAADSGVTIAFGTDTGPAARFQGYFEHMELERMADAGLTPEQVLRSATGDAARCLGLDELGTIEKGKWADFIVLNEDPLTDIEKMRSLDSVWISGNRVPQGTSE